MNKYRRVDGMSALQCILGLIPESRTEIADFLTAYKAIIQKYEGMRINYVYVTNAIKRFLNMDEISLDAAISLISNDLVRLEERN